MSNATLTSPATAAELASKTHRFGFFDDDDNLGVFGSGPSIDVALESAAYGVAALMDDGASVQPESARTFEFVAMHPAQALVTWLNLVIALATRERLTVCLFQVRHVGAHWFGIVWGAARTESRPTRRPVRGVQSTPVSVVPTESGWEARCILDW